MSLTGLFLDRIMSSVYFSNAWGYLIVYVLLLIVIIVGLIVLRAVRNKDLPVTPDRILSEYHETERHLSVLVKEAPTLRYTQIAKRRAELQIRLNKLIDASTKAIDDERDVTFEPVRDAFVRASGFLEAEKIVSPARETSIENFSAALREIMSVEENIKEISTRYKKVGK